MRGYVLCFCLSSVDKYNCCQGEANKCELIVILNHLLRLVILAIYLAVSLQFQSVVIYCTFEPPQRANPFFSNSSLCSSSSIVVVLNEDGQNFLK